MNADDILGDLQVVVYDAMHTHRFADSGEAVTEMMPILDRYVAAALDRLADTYYCDTYQDQRYRDDLRARAAELRGES